MIFTLHTNVHDLDFEGTDGFRISAATRLAGFLTAFAMKIFECTGIFALHFLQYQNVRLNGITCV